MTTHQSRGERANAMLYSILTEYGETTSVVHVRRCDNPNEEQRKVIFSDHASAAACALELWRVLGLKQFVYKCPIAKHHHHLTKSRQSPCACGATT